MTSRTLSGAVSLVLTLASGMAAAATITTPALGAFGTNRLVCTVANAGTKDVDVTIQIVNQAGANLVNLPVTVAAGEIEGAGTGQGPAQGYCRVTGAAKGKVRVALCMTDTVLNCLAAVPGE
jgi:hypothetical protein